MDKVTVSEDCMYFYITYGDSDADCYAQRKRQELPSEDSLDSHMPDTAIIRLCEALKQSQAQLKEATEYAITEASKIREQAEAREAGYVKALQDFYDYGYEGEALKQAEE